jgi:hypothetical protein
MATATKKRETLKALCHELIACESRYGQARARIEAGDWRETAHGYRVTLRYKRRDIGRRLTVDFWMGPANTSEPDAEGVLDCLMSDMQAGEQSFDEFCREFGYDEDSRTAERTWKACQRTAPKVRRFLGNDLETFLYADR